MAPGAKTNKTPGPGQAIMFRLSRRGIAANAAGMRWNAKAAWLYNQAFTGAEVAELADAQDLGSCGRKVVEVQVLSSALIFDLVSGGSIQN